MTFSHKILIFLICSLFLSTTLESQNVQIDSLKKELLTHPEKDSIRVNLLHELATASYKIDFEKTMTYIETSRSISDSIGFKKGKAKSLYLKGKTLAFQSNHKEGLHYYEEALELYDAIQYQNGIAECYLSMGTYWFYKSDQNKAMAYYKKSQNINEAIGNKKAVATCLLNIGMCYLQLGNYKESITYLKKSLTISTIANDEKAMSICYTSIGNVYNYQGNYPLALDYYDKSYNIDEKYGNTIGISNSLTNIGIIHYGQQNYDKAIASYDKALKIQKNSGNKNEIAVILNNLGLAYISKKEYKTALTYLQDALKIYQDIDSEIYIAICLNNIGDVYFQLNDMTTASQYFERAKKINLATNYQLGLCNSYLGIAKVYLNQNTYDQALSNALNSYAISSKQEILNYQRDAQKLLSEIYEAMGQHKNAYASHKLFKTLNDSLFNKENIEKITQLEYEYKYKQALDSASLRELKLTKTMQATTQDLQKSKRNYLWAIIAVLLVSILLGAIIFYQKLKNAKSKTQNVVMEQKLLRSQMTPHFIFNSLSVLQGMILNKEEKKSVHYLSKFSKLLRITLENSRDKTVSLTQELTAVQDYLTLQNLENEAYKCTILVEDTIDASLFEVPPMLIQPFVENAIEHAFVHQHSDRKIDIRLSYLDQKLICTIADNGVGINFKAETKNKHKNSLATTITSERLKVLSKDFKMEGSVTIEDRQKFNEQGTLVTLVIPHKINL